MATKVKKASKGSAAVRAKQVLDELTAWLGGEGRVEFSKPVARSAVAAAEKALKVSLPASYVEFVTTFGTFEISGALTGRGEGNDTVLLAPAEVVKTTRALRREIAQSDDEASQEVLEDGLVFCADPVDEYFHLFVVSEAHAGEMPTREYDYQDPANTDGWFEGDGSFETVVQRLAQQVRDA